MYTLKNKKQRINIFIANKDLALLDKLALENDTTRSQLIRHAVQKQYQLRDKSRHAEYLKVLDELQLLDADKLEKSSKRTRSQFNVRLNTKNATN